jgi:lauroyl/myristoyl acyltransferase
MTPATLRALRARAYVRLRATADSLLRQGLPPDHPEIVRVLCAAARALGVRLAPVPDLLLRDELRLTFGLDARTLDPVIREAHDVALQARVDLVLARAMDDAQLDGMVRVRGALRAPCVVVAPTTAPPELLARVIRRLAGAAAVRLVPDAHGTAGDAAAALAGGGVVVAPFDHRGWQSYDTVTFLGRPATLPDGPWALARAAGVPVVPATLVRAPDKGYRGKLGAPRPPDREAYLREEAEPFLRAHPGHYAAFLATCRRAPAEKEPQRPLFLDLP